MGNVERESRERKHIRVIKCSARRSINSSGLQELQRDIEQWDEERETGLLPSFSSSERIPPERDERVEKRVPDSVLPAPRLKPVLSEPRRASRRARREQEKKREKRYGKRFDDDGNPQGNPCMLRSSPDQQEREEHKKSMRGKCESPKRKEEEKWHHRHGIGRKECMHPIPKQSINSRVGERNEEYRAENLEVDTCQRRTRDEVEGKRKERCPLKAMNRKIDAAVSESFDECLI